jgi:hypothetical protein
MLEKMQRGVRPVHVGPALEVDVARPMAFGGSSAIGAAEKSGRRPFYPPKEK